jgi:hypothetical protein
MPAPAAYETEREPSGASGPVVRPKDATALDMLYTTNRAPASCAGLNG